MQHHLLYVIPDEHSSQRKLRPEERESAKAEAMGAIWSQEEGKYTIPAALAPEAQRALSRRFGTKVSRDAYENAVGEIAEHAERAGRPRFPKPVEVEPPSAAFMQAAVRLSRFDWHYDQAPPASERAEQGAVDRHKIRELLAELPQAQRQTLIGAFTPPEKGGIDPKTVGRQEVGHGNLYTRTLANVRLESSRALLASYKMLSTMMRTRAPGEALDQMRRGYAAIGRELGPALDEARPELFSNDRMKSLLQNVTHALQRASIADGPQEEKKDLARMGAYTLALRVAHDHLDRVRQQAHREVGRAPSSRKSGRER